MVRDLSKSQTKPAKPCPFTIYVDTAESLPYTFENMYSSKGEPLAVATEKKCLQRHPHSLGDYTADLCIGRCHIERKSMADAYGTFLGWDGRRDRFIKELENLSEIPAGLILVECTFPDLLNNAPEMKKTRAQNAKTLFRSILSWKQKFSVQWEFIDGRRFAEKYAFTWLDTFIRHEQEAEKDAEKARKKQPAQLSLLESI